MAVKKCLVCNNEFITSKARQKYCSDRCKAIGSKLVRKTWERATDYKSKVREAQRNRRKSILSERECLQSTERKYLISNYEKEHNEHLESHRKQLQERADKGDALAILQITTIYSEEYWRAYAKYLIQFAKESNTTPKTTVNGISVTDPDFPRKVIESRASLGCYVTEAK